MARNRSVCVTRTTRAPRNSRKGWQVSDITAFDMEAMAKEMEETGQNVIARLARGTAERMREASLREVMSRGTRWTIGWTR